MEIRSHYWPNTPELREIKILIDEEILTSLFLNQDEIWDLAKKFRYMGYELNDIANDITE